MLEVGNGGMNDEEYKLHFTMWAAVKSPLIIGTDVRVLSADSLSIYTNPAIIALNQDPAGSPVSKRWEYNVSDVDQYDMGTMSMWSGPLWSNNQAVIFLNADNTSRTMTATLADVFIDDGGAISPQAKMSYDVYDLWANRMPNATANMILDANSTVGATNVTSYYYNATETSYAKGLAMNDTRLMGVKVSSVKGLGTLTATVPRHGVVAYRLKPQAVNMKRDEL